MGPVGQEEEIEVEESSVEGGERVLGSKVLDAVEILTDRSYDKKSSL
jgi:hypothetical protein